MKIQIRIVKWDSRCIRFGIAEEEAWENCEYFIFQMRQENDYTE